MALYTNKMKNTSLLIDLDAAIKYLHAHAEFDSLGRAAFITRFSNKISTGISRLEQDLPGLKIKYNRMLRQEVNTFFDADAFNVDAFSPGPEYHIADAKVSLGEKLFNGRCAIRNGYEKLCLLPQVRAGVCRRAGETYRYT